MNATVNLVSEREFFKLKQFNTYDEVKNCDQYTLSTRWVITKKDGQI